MFYTPPDPLEDSTLEVSSEASTEADQLAILAQFGMNMARLLHDTADRLAIISPIEAAERLPPLTLAFDRMARTIRQTIALKHHLRTADTRTAARRATARRQVVRRVEDAIDARPDPRERENLLRDLHERLDDPALDEDLLTRDLADIVADLQHDLGIGAPCDAPRDARAKPRTPADIRDPGCRAASAITTQPAGQGTPPRPPD